ncbi:TetR/AcrR family transcriptional regulator [Mobilitalea sibirica]|uniref:TetR/AcrR family transcriptional regulator n=1 Tax=Mobilitalea sibirica TaxID=1462919 RepID=A0A8J7GYB5_9FIRM|nr:TetR/AcrR family transcriptional regulator [Mobilitalea sibirica]MBH1940419.1 TetR/AcrR family transcriptional regulator [Mobilitalea sibirica]
MPNKSYHHGDLKAELIRTGLKLLDQEGYEAFSLRKVAKACNVSQTAPYRHFKNKDELIIAIAMEAMGAFNECLQKAVDQHPDNPKKQLTEMGIAYIHFFVENPEYLRLLFLSDMRYKMNEYFCAHPEYFQNDHPFQTFFQTIERYKAAVPSSNQSLGKAELMLFSWGLVHGISILIANKEIPLEGDYLSMVRKIVESEKFLD